MPNWCWGRTAGDVAHPAFRTCSSKPSMSRDAGLLLATRRRRVRRRRPRSGPHTSPSSTAKPWGKPQVETDRRVSSAVAVQRPNADRGRLTGGRSRIRSARCSTRSSPCAAAYTSHRRAIVRIAFWTMIASIREAVVDLDRRASGYSPPSSGRRRSRGRRPRCSSITSGSIRAAACSSVSLDTCSMPRRHCARPPTRSGAAPADGRDCSSTAFPAICRSSSCESPKPRTSVSCASCCGPHEYLRMKQLAADLVILNERASSYVQELQIALETLGAGPASRAIAGPGRGAVGPGLHAPRRFDVRGGARPSLVRGEGGACRPARAPFRRLDRAPEAMASDGPAAKRFLAGTRPQVAQPVPELEFFNGLGGFANDGREYVTVLDPVSQRQHHGSTSSPTRLRLPGINRGRWLHLVGQQSREPNHSFVERPRHPIDRARHSICAMPKRVPCGARQRRQSVTKRQPISPAMAVDIAGSSIQRMGLRSTFSSTCRSPIRLRFRASCFATRRAARGIFR